MANIIDIIQLFDSALSRGCHERGVTWYNFDMLRHEQLALSRLSNRLRDRFTDRVALIVAFGSRVRGDHHEGSDLDLLIVVNGRSPDLEDGIAQEVVREELDSGVVITPVIKDSVAFEREKALSTPFYKNIVSEGLRL